MNKRKKISKLVKNAVFKTEPGAEIILFGSRARNDYSHQSDWDFLILTDNEATEDLKKKNKITTV